MKKLSLASLPTPIEKLSDLSQSLHQNIYMKRDDLTDMVASGNKIRKLEYALAQALDQGADMLITCGGLQSNHARATAAIAARLHLKCTLLLRKEKGNNEFNGNCFLDDLLGANLHIKEYEDFQQNKEKYLNDLKKEYEQKGFKPYIIPMGASNGIGTLGYIDAYQEILDYEKENNITFDTIICAVGSGGTYAGLYIANALAKQPKDIVGFNVCDSAAYFQNEIHQIISETLPFIGVESIDESHIHIIDGYVGKGYAQSQKSELDAIKKLAVMEGIILDPVYTGKAYVGMLHEIEKGTFHDVKNILFIHTGGLFGLLSKADEFENNIL